VLGLIFCLGTAQIFFLVFCGVFVEHQAIFYLFHFLESTVEREGDLLFFKVNENNFLEQLLGVFSIILVLVCKLDVLILKN